MDLGTQAHQTKTTSWPQHDLAIAIDFHDALTSEGKPQTVGRTLRLKLYRQTIQPGQEIEPILLDFVEAVLGRQLTEKECRDGIDLQRLVLGSWIKVEFRFDPPTEKSKNPVRVACRRQDR